MKKVQINKAKTEIDWSAKQWVQNQADRSVIVLTTGGEDKGEFCGTCLPCEAYPSGIYSTYWQKDKFQPLVGEIQFTISNED